MRNLPNGKLRSASSDHQCIPLEKQLLLKGRSGGLPLLSDLTGGTPSRQRDDFEDVRGLSLNSAPIVVKISPLEFVTVTVSPHLLLPMVTGRSTVISCLPLI